MTPIVPEPPQPPSFADLVGGSSVPRRLLLADDDDEVRLGIADLLGTIGLEVLQAVSGVEALELLRDSISDGDAVHAALLDVHMPGCGGLEALPRIQELRSGLPCLVYSGKLTEGLELSLRNAGACAVLRKPVQPDLLRREVLQAIASSPYWNYPLGGDSTSAN